MLVARIVETGELFGREIAAGRHGAFGGGASFHRT
jgi:hypothetical protein